MRQPQRALQHACGSVWGLPVTTLIWQRVTLFYDYLKTIEFCAGQCDLSRKLSVNFGPRGTAQQLFDDAFGRLPIMQDGADSACDGHFNLVRFGEADDLARG